MRTTAWLGGIVAFALLGGCVDRDAQQQARRTEEILADKTVRVGVATARAEAITEELDLTGQVVSTDDATIGARTAGRLVAVFVQDGDAVAAGQAIAQQDTSIASAQVRQAEGQLAAARAQLAQAISNARIGPQRTLAAVNVAEAQLRSARSQLEKARRGARSEERRQAEIQVESAKSNMETARKERDRQLKLYQEGATSLQRYELAENQYRQALAHYEAALEMLRLRQNQTQPEDLASAEEAVRQAEENVRNAKAQKALDVTLNEQVNAARAQVASAAAAVDLARQTLADATIRSPFSGRIAGKPAQPGSYLGPGSPVARLVGLQGVYFEGQVPESEIVAIVPGKPVDVRFDALPGQRFRGRVATINPLGETVSRLFRVRISLDTQGDSVKPGMFARGTIQLRTVPDAVMIPKSAIRTELGESFVFVLAGTRVSRRTVTLGLERGDLVQVRYMKAGETIVVKGQFQLKDGDTVQVETASGEAEGSPKVEG